MASPGAKDLARKVGIEPLSPSSQPVVNPMNCNSPKVMSY